MEKQDLRKLSVSAQEAIRVKVLRALDNNMRKVDIMKNFGVSDAVIYKWIKVRGTRKKNWFKQEKRGRPSQIRLTKEQEKKVKNMVIDKFPDQLKLPFALWTRSAVGDLLREKFDVDVSVWTVGRYLRNWGFTPQKPIYKAYEQKSPEVRKWLKKSYPAIKERASKEGSEIHWGDEMGMRSDHQTGTTWSPKGETPIIIRTGKRFRLNMISSVTNQGKLQFMLFKQGFTADVFVDFTSRLIRYNRNKVFLIVDGHPTHKSQIVKKWLEENADRIEIFFLPAYSPELNPDELVNQDVKTNAVGKHRTLNVDQLETKVENYLEKRKTDPNQVKKYFHGNHVKCAA
jgi:transposase